MLSIGTKAPEFSALDQSNKLRSLADYKGKYLILYFYPRDDTPGCTKEACSFRDSYHQLEIMNVSVIGVSKDSVVSHKKFADKYHIGFPLLADPDKVILKSYEAWGKKKFMGREFEGTLRVSYLIDPKGVIVKNYPKVNPLVHAAEINEDLKNLMK